MTDKARNVLKLIKQYNILFDFNAKDISQVANEPVYAATLNSMVRENILIKVGINPSLYRINKDFLYEDVLGDVIISIDKVKEQAEEYGHSFERELSYMLVHGFYHLMGYDHMNEQEKKEMREKEEKVLNLLNIKR